MAKVLITTTYSSDSIVLLTTKLGIDRIFLLVDKKPNKTQQKTIDSIVESFGNVLEVKQRKIELYDIVKIAKECVNIIDVLPKDDEIFVNITPSKKTQALGLLFGSYSRSKKIKNIYYCPADENQIITLPILSFDLSESQLQILENIESTPNLSKLAGILKQSRAMLYRNVKELKHKGLLEEKDGLKLTDAGKIARM